VKSKAEIIKINNLNVNLIEGFEAQPDKPLLTVVFKLRKSQKQKHKLYFNMMNGKELTENQVMDDSWTGEDVGPVYIGLPDSDVMKKKPKLRKQPKRNKKGNQ